MEDDKETAKIISSTTDNSNKGSGGDDVAMNEGGGGDDVAMNEGDTSSDSSFSRLSKRKLEGPETTFESPSKKTKLNADQDVVNTTHHLSKGSSRRSVCITSAGGSVSTLDLRTPNVPFTHQIIRRNDTNNNNQ